MCSLGGQEKEYLSLLDRNPERNLADLNNSASEIDQIIGTLGKDRTEVIAFGEEDMRYAKIAWAMGVLLSAAMAAQSAQLDLTCPSQIESYCGGWTVTFFEFVDEDSEDPAHTKDAHLKVNERFVIGEKWPHIRLFPRGDLRGPNRWGPIVDLTPIVVDGKVKCLVGYVVLKQGHEGGGRGNAGKRHGIIIDSEVKESVAEIGLEHQLELRLFTPPDSSSSTLGSCEPPSNSDNRHAGTAHVQD